MDSTPAGRFFMMLLSCFRFVTTTKIMDRTMNVTARPVVSFCMNVAEPLAPKAVWEEAPPNAAARTPARADKKQNFPDRAGICQIMIYWLRLGIVLGH